MVIVRLLLFLAIGAIVASGLLYLFTRDRRYLRFVVQVAKFTIWLLAGVTAVLPVRAPRHHGLTGRLPNRHGGPGVRPLS